MKNYLTKCARMALLTLLGIYLTGCFAFKPLIETSLDAAHKRYSGDSYLDPEADEMDIGFNVAYMMIMAPPRGTSPYPKSFLEKEYEYQLAYASRPRMVAAATGNREEVRYPPSLSYRTSEDRFIDHLNLLTGLEFVQKNSKDEDTKLKLNYLQVPVVVLYMHDLGEERKVFGGLGPYFAYGVGGKIKGNGFSEKAFGGDFGFKRFDAGLTFTGGYNFNKQWSVRLAYDLGLANIEDNSVDKAKNRCISLSVGYSLEKLAEKLGVKQ